ncbi:MAG: metalloregulator ArsR/SmtB family transcription factor [Anaerolineae bacterium]|nr:metalloregulator ArsR/SmtB family transcription factor [Anaerolineae bacterium]
MVYYSTSLDHVFSALSDPTRRAIISKLAKGEISIMELASPFNMSLPAVSKHVRILEDAGLLTRKKRGRVHYCRLNAHPLRDAAQWLVFYQQFWDTKLDALANFLKETSE